VLRWRFSINPATVYRKAMLQLNANPGVLEVRCRAIRKNVHLALAVSQAARVIMLDTRAKIAVARQTSA